MYEDYDELEEAEELEPEEVQELLEEDSEAKEIEESEEKAEARSELDSRKHSGVAFGSASDNVRYYSDKLERDINSNNPSRYWTNHDANELEKAKAEADKEKQ